MAAYTQTYTFTNGTTADGGQVNTEIVALGSSVNNIVDAQVSSSANIAETKFAAGIRARVTARQGGSASDWTSPGTSTQAVSTPIVQCGAFTTNASTGTTGAYTYTSDTITFPIAFSKPPIVIAIVNGGNGWVKTNTATTTQVTIVTFGRTADAPSLAAQPCEWIAIGE